jgi:hypothetical protein
MNIQRSQWKDLGKVILISLVVWQTRHSSALMGGNMSLRKHYGSGVEEEIEFRRFVEPGRPVTANGVSAKGENTSRTREKRRK